MLLLLATILLVVGGVIATTFAGFYAMEPIVGTSVAGLIVAAVYLSAALSLNIIMSMRHNRGIS
jgi:divalent metal cation (Fe/Co/Zn/Cd) transporter